VVKCRIDSFRLAGTGSICHMFLSNVEFSNTFRFRVFQCHFSTVSRFQSPQCWHGRTEYWKLPAFIPNIQNVVTNFSCWQCLYALISLLYKQLLQYTLLKPFTVPSAVLTKFAKKFQTKLLAPAFDFTKLSTKTLLLWRCHVSFEYRGLLQNTPASFLLFLSMLKLHCKRHYRNLAIYIAGVQHDVNTSQKRRRRDADIRSAAAAHSSIRKAVVTVTAISLAWSRRIGAGGHICYIMHLKAHEDMSLYKAVIISLDPTYR